MSRRERPGKAPHGPLPVAAVSVLLAAPIFAGCSDSHATSPDELRSDLRTLESLASETALFNALVREGRSSDAYTDGQAESLRDRALELDTRLESAIADAETGEVLAQGRTLALELRHLLERDDVHGDLSTEADRLRDSARRLRDAL